MVGTLVQLIVMVGYGNHASQTPEAILISFNRTAHFSIAITSFFIPEKRKNFFSWRKLITIAENPLERHTYLSGEGCQALRLYYEGSESGLNNADHRTAGKIGGGGTWIIETVYPK